MRSGDPTNIELFQDPLYWVEHAGKKLIKIATDCLEGGLLKGNDVEHMRHLRQETETLLEPLLGQFRGICQTNPGISLALAPCFAKLLENALAIGLVVPPSSESAKAAIAAGRARAAREGKAQTPRSVAVNEAFRAALPADWKERNPWTLAGQMKPKMDKAMPQGTKGIGQQAIYDRLSKALKEPM
jgi:hypothetical protein